MAVTRIILWLGYSAVFLAALMGASAFAALLLLDFHMAVLMSVSGLFTFMFGAIFVLIMSKTPSRETNSDALVFLLLFWCLSPVLAATPFWLNAPEGTWLRSYFHAVSAMTSTGASGYVIDDLPQSLVFWQSILQFFGGVSVATFAVVILAALNLTGTGIHRSNLFALKKGELFPRLVGIGRIVAGIYALIASVCCVLMILGGAPLFESICLSLAGVSTGGIPPRSEDLFIYIPRFAAFVLAVSCALGAMNISIIWDVFRVRNWRNLRRLYLSVEHRTLISLTIIITFLGLFYAGLQNIFPIFIEAIFFISTAGFIYDPISIEQIPSVVLIAIALVGGSALSTAGGLKMIRIILLFKHLSTDISRLSHPSRVLPVSFKRRIIPDQAFLSIWMYFFGYTLVLGAGIVGFGVIGLDFADATTVSAAALANIGPLLPATIPDSGLSWHEMTAAQMALSSALMLVGRVEVLAVLVLITPSFWRQ
ncbi:trk system potassium uptake protein TrkH [Litorimonas taeanensis]|uniref:Trk system potassium uptake protein TrkH n=1 Tax=Litorimonas taeanensis TaxID=568099 RepID=A0A420WJA1_9PROT|nr:potassium transporter TrkG [Litorimonas taeanensis]RKQ71078.1 trk system potassium uptake protein TrkH [Litorimonas taeanensis]